MDWLRLLAYITGRVDKGRLQLSDGEKSTLAEIAHRLGRKALAEVAVAAKPDTILGWFRKLVARKFDGSRFRTVHRATAGRYFWQLDLARN